MRILNLKVDHYCGYFCYRNIVSTVNLDCKLDIKQIALQARNAEYNPKVCTGAKSEQQSKLAARKYARIIQKLGFPAKFKDFKIQNIVGSCDVKFPIRLEGLAYSHGAFSSYEPELFPGLIYRMKQPKIVLLIFVSGKLLSQELRSEMKPTQHLRTYTLSLQSSGRSNSGMAQVQSLSLSLSLSVSIEFLLLVEEWNFWLMCVFLG
ncbi:hypothetical protein EZV62_007570 [Acer yangbiense]|uniref:TATA-box-binding protein n=1 Tax=Acer yangbiense TaxID=1000413 RepID=A0A5C7IAM7_9ROSI|nr:hypothetical protein EZV62_007570 [Acer yangbiense]